MAAWPPPPTAPAQLARPDIFYPPPRPPDSTGPVAEASSAHPPTAPPAAPSAGPASPAPRRCGPLTSPDCPVRPFHEKVRQENRRGRRPGAEMKNGKRKKTVLSDELQ